MTWGPTKWMGSKLTSDGDAGREVGWLQKFRKKKNGSIESICCSLPAVSTSGPLLPATLLLHRAWSEQLPRLLKPSW